MTFTPPTSNPLTLEQTPEQVALAGQGLVAETFPRAQAVNTQAMVSGIVYFVGLALLEGQVVTNMHTVFSVGGSSLTLSKVGLYTVSGVTATLVASSANLGTSWESTGFKTHALTAPYVVPADAYYYAAMLAVGAAGMPTTLRATASTFITGVVAGFARPYGSLTAQTDLPASGDLGQTTPAAVWLGCS